MVNVFAPSATVVEATPDSAPMVSLFSSSNWAAAVVSVTADPSGIALPLCACSVPAVMLVVPEYVPVPDSVTVPPCAVMPPVPPMPPASVSPVPVLSKNEPAVKVTAPLSAPAPAVLPMVPPPSDTALAGVAPLLTTSRLPPTTMPPLPASAPAPEIVSVPLPTVVPPV